MEAQEGLATASALAKRMQFWRENILLPNRGFAVLNADACPQR